MRGARESGVINMFLVSRSDGIRRLGCVGAGKVCAGIGGSGEHDDCMDYAQPNRRQSVSTSEVWARQNCRLRRLGAINPQIWMARHNICAAHFDLAMLSLRRAFSLLKSTRTCGLFRLRQMLAVHSHKKRRRPIVRVSSGAILFIKADMSPSKKLIIGNVRHCVAISVKGKPVLKTMTSYISFKRNRPETY